MCAQNDRIENRISNDIITIDVILIMTPTVFHVQVTQKTKKLPIHCYMVTIVADARIVLIFDLFSALGSLKHTTKREEQQLTNTERNKRTN